ncbi:MAG: glycosyltransferase family 4 protein [Thermomicrobiales bacterium]
MAGSRGLQPGEPERRRLIGTVVGDVVGDPSAAIKYGYLFDELARSMCLLDVLDASLDGFDRWWNAARTFHPRIRLWKERFYKNVPAFRSRSSRIQERIRRLHPDADVVLQIGTLFDSRWKNLGLPSAIYTDYTSALSARHRPIDRSPFSNENLQIWLGLEREAYHNTHHIFARSGTVRTSLIEDYDVPESRISIVGGGVNLAELPEVISRTASREPTVLFVGKELHRKGGDLALEAFADVRKRNPNARFVLVTGDPLPPELPTDGVEVLPPTWKRDEIRALYERADLFILPSRLETWGDVVLEAMAHGLPCIVSGGEAMEEIVQHGETGLVVHDLSAGKLADAIFDLINNPACMLRMGRCGRRRVEREFTWQAVTERMVPVLREIAETN